MSENATSSGAIVVISCMDRRLVNTLKPFENTGETLAQKIDTLSKIFKTHGTTFNKLKELLSETQGKNVIILSNAGTNVNGLSNTLQEISSKNNGIERIILVTHTDCGGMSIVTKGLVEGATESSDKFFKHLGGSAYSSAYHKGDLIETVRATVEKMNAEIQKTHALKFSNNVVAVHIDVKDLALKEEGHEHVLVCALPGTYGANFEGTPRDQTYGVVGNVRDTVQDVRIATDVLGMKKVLDFTSKNTGKKLKT